jgi:hypothetical protein
MMFFRNTNNKMYWLILILPDVSTIPAAEQGDAPDACPNSENADDE